MSDAFYNEAARIFTGACDLGPDERETFLDDACGDDTELRRAVTRLLAHDRAPGTATPDALAGAGPDALAEALHDTVRAGDAADAALPSRIGRYAITGMIAAGGMGVVYEARQENPRRTVALKVIRPDLHATERLRRFRLEAEVLGQLQHPGIAQVYEAGVAPMETAGGQIVDQPFFAMEFIRGKPLNEYADERRLGLRDRLELIATICDGVQHAHYKGVVHRDLKPANVLVDEAGRPKILDFGVARATDSDVHMVTTGTGVGQLVGTLPYMSPEQVSGDPDRLDTRSDIYALGVMLFELLAGRLPVDLRGRSIPEAARLIDEQDAPRLGTVDVGLRGDVETIVAKALEKERERRYQTASELGEDIRRFLRDEPVVARPATTVYQLRKFAKRNKVLVGGVLATTLALIVGLVGSVRFAVGERREAERAGAINTFLLEMLAWGNPDVNPDAREMTVQEMLDRAAAGIVDAFGNQPASEAAVRQTIGTAYATLGRSLKAIVHLEQCVALYRHLDDDEHLAEALGELARARLDAARYETATQAATEALAIDRRLFGDEHRRVMIDRSTLGAIATQRGDYASARSHLDRALGVGRRVLDDDDPAVARVCYDLAVVHYHLSEFEPAELLLRESADIYRSALGDDHPDYAESLIALGVILRAKGDLDGADAVYGEATPVVQAAYGDDHPAAAVLVNNRARLLQERGELEEARVLFVDALSRQRRLLGDDHPEVNLARRNLANLDVARGDYDAAEPALRASLAFDRAKYGIDHMSTRSSAVDLAALFMARSRFAEAEPLYREVVESLRRTGSRPEVLAGNLMRYATCLRDLDRFADAETLLREAHTLLDASNDAEHRTRPARMLVELYERWGKPDEAERWRATSRDETPGQ